VRIGRKKTLLEKDTGPKSTLVTKRKEGKNPGVSRKREELMKEDPGVKSITKKRGGVKRRACRITAVRARMGTGKTRKETVPI